MYKFEQKILAEKQSCKYYIHKQNEQIRYVDFIKNLQHEKSFRSFFIDLLSDIPFCAYHWETPPVTVSTQKQPFEFVVSNSPGIDLPPNPGPFRQYFDYSDAAGTVAVFNNLGDDAKLIAPAPMQQNINYSHIGVFTQEAPTEQQHALWQTVGQVTNKLISGRPLWLNTAGGGVPWLHVRLDSRPKYYRHKPYCTTD